MKESPSHLDDYQSTLRKIFDDISRIMHTSSNPDMINLDDQEFAMRYDKIIGDTTITLQEQFVVGGDQPKSYLLSVKKKGKQKKADDQYYFDADMNMQFLPKYNKEHQYLDKQIQYIEIQSSRSEILDKLTKSLEAEDQNIYATNKLPEKFGKDINDTLQFPSSN